LHGLLQLPCGRYQHDYQRVQIDPSGAGFARVLARPIVAAANLELTGEDVTEIETGK
jgi:hypothetical protein